MQNKGLELIHKILNKYGFIRNQIITKIINFLIKISQTN